MSKLLTIALPTYNRAGLLDRQLSWLAEAVDGHEDDCEILLSDNCSTDETPQILERWRDALGTSVRVHRHERNLGAVRNIASCIQAARTEYVWTISDDDTIAAGAVGDVLARLRSHPELDVLVLNFSSRDVPTGQLNFARCFDVEREVVWPIGRYAFEHFVAVQHPARWGGLSLTTALVYRSEAAQAALATWPEGLDNLNVQLYVTAALAAKGPMCITEDILLECAGGTHHFMSDDRVFLRFVVAEYAESFVRLLELGYAPRVCRGKVLDQRSYVSRKLLARCLARDPRFTISVLWRWVTALRRTHAAVKRQRQQALLA